MKKLLIMCGTGIATSTIVSGKVKTWLEENGYKDNVRVTQGMISEELTRINDYDVIVSTTLVPDNVKDKVINGVNLITGIGTDEVFHEIKKQLDNE